MALFDLASSFMNKEDTEDGFSLVELLVVIVIIGILSSIAIAAFANQRKKAVDASLISDVRTTGTQMTGFFSDGVDIDYLSDLTGLTEGHEIALGAYGEGRSANNPVRDWNTYDELPTIQLSEGTHMTVTLIRNNNGAEYVRTAPGDFCLSADNWNSSYPHSKEGVTGTGNYDKLVFYDPQLGGIKYMDDLVEAVENDKPLSCRHFAMRYMGQGKG